MPRVFILATRNFSRLSGLSSALVSWNRYGFIGAAASFGNEQKFVFIPFGGIEIDLRRQIVAGVDLLVHIQRDGLGIAQIFFGVGFKNSFGEEFLIFAAGPDLLAFFADDGGCARILAERELKFGGNFGIAQHGDGNAAVVVGSFRIAQDLGNLLVVFGPQQKRNIPHCLSWPEKPALPDRF